MVRQLTKAEANYAWCKVRRNVCASFIESLTVPYIPFGKSEEPKVYRESRLDCLNYHCERLEEWDRKVEYWARELGLPEEKWKREAQ